MGDHDVIAIARKSAHGIFALVSRTFFLQFISYGTSIVIFTLLLPSDVGAYTAAIAGQRIISFFTDFGLGAALIQKKDELVDDDIHTVFTLQVVVTFGFFILAFLFRNAIAAFFMLTQPALVLFLVLVFCVFLSSFKIIPSILLEREVQFQKLVIPQILESLVFNAILVFLVLQGNGISSYSWAFLVSALFGIPFYYIVSPWKIGLGFHKKSFIHLKFGLQFQAKNILATIKDDLLTVFLAKTLSFTDLGYIGFAQRNAFFSYRFIVDNITKVTFSTYARIQDDAHALKKVIEKSLFLVSSTIFPLLFGLIIIAPYIITYVPGWSKWEPAVLSLIFFSLNAVVSSLSGILVNVLDATGKVKTTLRLMVLWTTLTWVFTPLAIHFFGYNGVAIVSFFITLTIIITIYLVKKIVYFQFIRSIQKPVVAACAMSVFVYMAASIFARSLPAIGIIIVLGGILYGMCMYLLSGDEIKKDIAILFLKK